MLRSLPHRLGTQSAAGSGRREGKKKTRMADRSYERFCDFQKLDRVGLARHAGGEAVDDGLHAMNPHTLWPVRGPHRAHSHVDPPPSTVPVRRYVCTYVQC